MIKTLKTLQLAVLFLSVILFAAKHVGTESMKLAGDNLFWPSIALYWMLDSWICHAPKG